MSELHIVPFADLHLEGALWLSREAGWPHRLEDWQLVAAVSEGVALLDGARLVATGFCTCYGEQARLSMVIVDKALRGRGIGRRMMAALMELAGPRAISLVATAEGQPLYEKLGFVPAEQILQYQGVVRSEGPPAPVRIGGTEATGAVLAIDRQASGTDRSALLLRLIAGGTLLLGQEGCAILRAFGRGLVLGPVIARNEEQAQVLIRAAADRVEGQFLRIDLPAGRLPGAWLERLGLLPVGGGTAMRRGAAALAGGAYTTYALVSQGLG